MYRAVCLWCQFSRREHAGEGERHILRFTCKGTLFWAAFSNFTAIWWYKTSGCGSFWPDSIWKVVSLPLCHFLAHIAIRTWYNYNKVSTGTNNCNWPQQHDKTLSVSAAEWERALQALLGQNPKEIACCSRLQSWLLLSLRSLFVCSCAFPRFCSILTFPCRSTSAIRNKCAHWWSPTKPSTISPPTSQNVNDAYALTTFSQSRYQKYPTSLWFTYPPNTTTDSKAYVTLRTTITRRVFG